MYPHADVISVKSSLCCPSLENLNIRLHDHGFASSGTEKNLMPTTSAYLTMANPWICTDSDSQLNLTVIIKINNAKYELEPGWMCFSFSEC